MSKKRLSYRLAALVSSLTLLLYLAALRNDFVTWDDGVNVYDNLYIRSLDWLFLKWAFTDISVSYWQPLTWISHALDYAVWGLNPMGHHLTNIILHSINTFLVIWMIVMLFAAAEKVSLSPTSSPSRGQGYTGSPPARGGVSEKFVLITAGVTGLLFGIHPLHVESVAWVTERKDLLCTLFFLLSTMAYVRHAETVGGTISEEARGSYVFQHRYYLLSLSFFVLALSSKPMAVTLPVVFLLLDWYPLRRILSPKAASALLLEKVPFLALGLIASMGAMAHKTPAEVISLADFTLTGRIFMAAKALIFYLAKMAVPFGLSPYYPDPENISALSFEYMGPVILACGITATCALLAKKHKILFAAWGYYIVTLLPVLGIVKTKAVTIADRFTYLPSVGPFLLAGLGAAWLWSKAGSLKQGDRIIKWLTMAAALAACILLSHATLRQIEIWKNGITLWSNVIEKEPARVPIAYNNRGTAFKELGDFDRAMEDYNTHITLDRTAPNAYNNRGLLFKEQGQLDRAIEDFTSAIAVKSDMPYSYNNRGLAYKDQGNFDLAIRDFDTAIRLAPDYADAYTSRGWTFKEMGQPERAMEDYNTAITIDPTRYIAFNNRGMIFQEMGQVERAIAEFTTAIKLNPFFAQAYTNRGVAHEQAGQAELALQDYNLSIKEDPSFANAYNNRGLLFERTGRFDQALEDFNVAIRLNPSGVESYNNRGLVFEDMGRFDRAIEDYTRAIELKPEEPLAYSNRGIAFSKLGSRDRALSDFKSACERGGVDGCEALRNPEKRQ